MRRKRSCPSNNFHDKLCSVAVPDSGDADARLFVLTRAVAEIKRRTWQLIYERALVASK